MEPQTVNIPANFTDAGRILGLFNIRNTVEMLIFTVPIAFIFFACFPFGLTVKIIAIAVVIVPIAGFSLNGRLPPDPLPQNGYPAHFAK